MLDIDIDVDVRHIHRR